MSQPDHPTRPATTPTASRGDFLDIVAVIAAYNEEDIIDCSIRKLTDQGIGVYLIDNWSSDETLAIAKTFEGKGLIGYEQFPAEGPTPYFSLRSLMRRTEAMHVRIGARWCIHQDVDEVRASPWPGVSLREGLERVEREGFNCVNHICLIFRPIDDSFVSGADMEAHFRHFEFGQRPGHFLQMKAWSSGGAPFELASRGGHSVDFPGKRVYPVPFLLKHYPVRGQTHGLRKILKERKARFDPQERAMGWHIQYDAMDENTNFLANRESLLVFDEQATKERLLRFPLTPPFR